MAMAMAMAKAGTAKSRSVGDDRAAARCRKMGKVFLFWSNNLWASEGVCGPRQFD
jgi:hypothetical protein